LSDAREGSKDAKKYEDLIKSKKDEINGYTTLTTTLDARRTEVNKEYEAYVATKREADDYMIE
jgi:hypothetical protein